MVECNKQDQGREVFNLCAPTELVRCLNEGYVKYIDHLGDDQRIVNAARVMEEEWRGHKDVGLINYMLRERHTSPFEHVVFTFRVCAPIFVFRQWYRHRTWSYNEISARYQVLPDTFYIPEPRMIGFQGKKNHQSRTLGLPGFRARAMRLVYIAYCKVAFKVYTGLLNAGWPREIARGVLPVATYSKMYATVDLHNLFHFLSLRDDPHAQHEVQVYAKAMRTILEERVPVAAEAFERQRDLWRKFHEWHSQQTA